MPVPLSSEGMRKWKLIAVVLALVLAAGAVVAYLEWNRTPPQAAGEKAAETVKAEDLFKAYTDDEAAANARFNDKVVQVNGTVREVNGGENGAPVNVLLETGDPLGAVVCEFGPGTELTVSAGDAVSVKGFCAGYNLDVLLQRCAIVE